MIAGSPLVLHDFMLRSHGKMPEPMLVGYQGTVPVDYMISLRDHR
jgi:hypothetical protein